jgi:hypothetical protein
MYDFYFWIWKTEDINLGGLWCSDKVGYTVNMEQIFEKPGLLISNTGWSI